MSALKIFPRSFRTIFNRFLEKNTIGSRTILSEAYSCDDEWQKRFESPILRSTKMNIYFVEVDKKFGTKRLASGVDIDIFANCIREESELEEMEHLLYRFRKTKRVAEMTDSTPYSVIKAYLKFHDYESLFRILRNRESYGIFPDLYSYNLLMDTFLEKNCYRDAAEVAVLMMLQEDFGNPISRILGLYSCQKFLTECTLESWHGESEKAEETSDQGDDDDEDEMTYVRVPYLRNPFFDDHFDIKDPKHLIGKTFYLIGRAEGDTLGHTYQLIGLGMYEKWEKAIHFLESLTKNPESSSLLEEGITKFREMLSAVTEENENKLKWLKEFEENVKVLSGAGKLVSGDLGNELEKALQKIPKFEEADITTQNELFLKWESIRQDLLKAQEKDVDKERRLKIIAEKKEELYWKEKFLFFFENEEKVMEELEEVNKIVDAAEKEKISQDKGYEPPKIIKRRPTKLSSLRKKAMVRTL